MVFSRASALRASSITRYARPARCIRAAELQPWQRTLQRRSYASAHGGEKKKSELPWAVTSLTVTALATYLVITQDTGGHHDAHHEEHHDKKHEDAADETADEEAPAEDEQKEEKEEPKEAPNEERKPEREDGPREEKKDDPKIEEKEQTKGTAPADPAKSDEPGASFKEEKSQNEMSGKQAGLSNDATSHSHPLHQNPEKSRKGEGVAETSKLQGTVSTNRPSAENKEERGKAEQDKSK